MIKKHNFSGRNALRVLMLLAFFTLHSSLFTLNAQTIGDAFYVYHNDGQFNAFFRDEVQRIDYSYEDADGNRYDEIVTQLVYTADSVYKIPLAAIDSVSFVQPETIVNSEVFPLTAEHSPYVSNADIDRFTMDAATPTGLQPKQGNIVVANAECDAFADGIMARVTSVSKTGSGIEYTCEPVGFEEVFDQLVYYGEVGSQESAGAKSTGPRRAAGSLTKVLWNEPWSKTISYGGTTTQINVSDKASMKVTFCKTSREAPLFLRVELLNSLQSRLDFNAKSEAEIAPDPWQIGSTLTIGKITIPIPYTFGMIWLAPKVSLFAYFKEHGKVELDYGCHFNRDDKMIFTYQNGTWNYNYAPKTDLKTDIARLSMEGSAEVGVIPKVFFSLNGTRAGFGADVQVGVKEYINFIFDATRLKDGGLYAANKDSYCRTTIPYSVKLYANANLFGRYDARDNDQGAATISYTFADEKPWGEDKYLLPLFSNLRNLTPSKAHRRFRAPSRNHSVSVSVSRDVLLPAEIGMQLADDDGNVVGTQSAGYSSQSFNDENYTFSFTGLTAGREYEVRPTVSLLGYTLAADQKVSLKEEAELCPDANHPHMIDLGLPSGTKWACCNVGASAPEQYGSYFAWGETSPKNYFSWDNYTYYNSNTDHDYIYIGSDIAGTEYDAATANWGSPWRMPSCAQCEELYENCSWTCTTQNGVDGMKFTGPNGGTIFLPAAGFRWEDFLDYAGSYIYYWSSSLYEWNHDSARYLNFGSGKVYMNFYGRILGLSVRPVRKN